MPLKDILLPHRVHLLGGCSDAGKTSFILPAMIQWSPRWVYVSGDRSELDAFDKFDQLGIDRAKVPFVPAFGRQHKEWRAVVQVIEEWSPKPEYIVFEGFQRRCENHNSANSVFNFLNSVDAYLQPSKQFPDGLTMLGIAESPKQKANDRYLDPRQRISGCSAWASHASTVLMVESLDEDLASALPDRQLWVCRKNRPRVRLTTEFTSCGQLVFEGL